ncbi:C-5 sterol desaturase [Gossypium arboreum]|uniref:C-5 sterol desaturase n=1 Tax=Gossypium arboreum TaxID=29729 RepID=A0A0B0PJ73_GOSAR|nr:C-5 sterol desaturase [Gossypium arboreum]KHG23407.1 C-5 sterol desaturase [Gossypium arboreum]
MFDPLNCTGRVNRESLGRHPRKTRACDPPVRQGLSRVIFSIWSVLSLFGSLLVPFDSWCSPEYKK